MKTLSKTLPLPLMAFALIAGFHAGNAQAFLGFGKKLDLNAIQGNYNVVIQPNMYLGCPDSITVVYDPKNATLDSEAFHFSNIDRGSKSVGQDFDPDHAAYSEQWVVTKTHSNSVTEEQVDGMTTSDTSQVPMDPGPLEAPAPGSAESMGLVTSSNIVTTALKYNSKKQTLTKTVDADGMDLGEDCTFVKAQ